MEKTADFLKQEERHDFSSLVEIMKLLRSENGCPWDKEQTHESIRANFIEETYEVVEAIDNQDPALMREELGDVLLQVVFHALISEEAGEFNMDDVIHDICAKLIHRHPHIFADVQADTSDAVLTNWEKIKTEEKHRVGLSGTLQAIPPSLPSLMKAQKIVKKTSKANLSPDPEVTLNHLRSACEAVPYAVQNECRDALKKSLSDILVAVSSIAQENGLDAEEILSDACRQVSVSAEDAEAKWGTDLSQLSKEDRKTWSAAAFFSE